MSARVSIILPTYNGAQYIAGAIESVLVQTYPNWELIIVDDGSTDDTEKVVTGFVDQRIIYIKNEGNLGIQKTLNRGIALAKGEYIARIDDDDRWIDKEKLSTQVQFLGLHPEYVLVGTGAILVTSHENEVSRYLLPESDYAIRNRMLGKNCFAHSTVMYTKSAVDEVGGYSEQTQKRHIEDYDLWLRLGIVGNLYNLPRYSTALCVRPESITARHRVIQAWRICKSSIAYRAMYPRVVSGFIISFSRFVFFVINKILPIPQKIIYRIQALQRSI